MKKGLAALLCWLVLALPAAAGEVTGHFDLMDQNGRPVTDASFAGRVRVVAFGYTFCPDVCPTTLSTIAATLDILGPKAAGVVPLFITVDPRRDTPTHLKDYMEAFGPSFVGLTGPEDAVAAAAAAFHARYAIQPPADPADPNTYFVDHSAGIYVMDRQGAFVAKLGHRATPDELAERLEEVLRK
ncbi:MAG TPA: SCO family protein [Magnetospirillum sp.]|jgi:protein SCO1/2|nr:SCO family protein [Magnetospirillum sp.]